MTATLYTFHSSAVPLAQCGESGAECLTVQDEGETSDE